MNRFDLSAASGDTDFFVKSVVVVVFMSIAIEAVLCPMILDHDPIKPTANDTTHMASHYRYPEIGVISIGKDFATPVYYG